MTEPIGSPTGWSSETKGCLVFWIILVVATPVLLVVFPDWFIFPQRRQIRLENVPAVVLIVVWILGVIAVIAYVLWYRDMRRTEELTGIALELNVELTPEPEDNDWGGLQVFKFFRIGFDHSARNLMIGKLGRFEVAVLDYRFERSRLRRDIETPKSSRTYHQTVVAFWHVSSRLPDFQLVSRESWWTSPGKYRSPKGCVEDLKFGKGVNDDFCKHYKVHSKDKNQLGEYFTPQLLEYFSSHKGWDVESVEGHLLIYQERRVQPPAKMIGFLEESRQITETLRGCAEGKGK